LQWDEFLLVYKGDVDKSLSAYVVWADQQVANLNGVPPPPGGPNVPSIAENADLGTLPLAPITAEMTRLEALFSADRLVRDQYSALTTRIAQETSAPASWSVEERLTVICFRPLSTNGFQAVHMLGKGCMQQLSALPA
jgi:hypothetical protein